jgi:hypothetical protein
MANRINTDPTHKLINHDQFEAPTLNYLPSRNKNIANTQRFDDVIVSLSNAYENRRARQAAEWERMGRENLQLIL